MSRSNMVITTAELIKASVKNLDSPDLEQVGQKALPKILNIFSKCVSHTFNKLDDNAGLKLAVCNLPFFGEFSRIKGAESESGHFNFNPSKYMQLQTGIDKMLKMVQNQDTLVKKELNLGKLSELCSLPENDIHLIVFTLVKTIGFFTKIGYHVIVDIRMPGDMFLLVAPTSFEIKTKSHILGTFQTPIKEDPRQTEADVLSKKRGTVPSKRRAVSIMESDHKS